MRQGCLMTMESVCSSIFEKFNISGDTVPEPHTRSGKNLETPRSTIRFWKFWVKGTAVTASTSGANSTYVSSIITKML